jgi:hypothetical protein
LLQPIGVAAVFIIAGYNGQEGKKLGVWFYWFYPLHLALIYVIVRYLM